MHGRFGIFMGPAHRSWHVHRPASSLDDRQDVGTERIAHHDETVRRDAVPGEDGRVDVGRLVADDFDVSKAANQTGAFELRSLVEEIAFRDQHEGPRRRQRPQCLLRPREQFDLFGQHLFRKVDEIPEIAA